MTTSILAALAARAPTFDKQRECFQRAGVVYSGLIPTLRKTFYATFKIHRRRGSKRQPGAPPMSFVTKARGCRIHEQLGLWGRTGRTPLDSLARQISVSLHQRGIRLVASEVPIADEDARVATAIDAIGEDSEGRVVIIEFKAGYQKGTHGHGPLDNLPGLSVPSTPLNHALLQLGMTRAILEENYGVYADQYLLVVSNGGGVTLRSLPAWTRQLECTQIRSRPKGAALPSWGCSDSDDE
jgi:hypothetical protein